MAVEAKRRCGYRKVGGLYLTSGVARSSSEELEALKKQGITPVFVPHDDPDHAARPKKEASK